MLNEGFKIDLLRRDREKARKQARAERKAKWKARRDQTFKSGFLTGLSMYATDRTKPFEDRKKYDMESRTLDKMDRKRAKRSRKMERDVQEGFGSDKVKPWLTKKSPKFKAALKKHGPALQKHADKWGGKAAMVGHHVDKFTKSNPRTTTALKWGGSIAAGVAAGTISNLATHYMTHKAKMKDANYEYETRRRHGRVREHYSGVCEDLSKMRHTQKAASNVNHRQAAHVSVMRSMAQDKVAAAGRGIMNDKRFKVPNKTQTGMRKESVSDLLQGRASYIYAIDEVAAALAPLAGAGIRAVGSSIAKKAAQVTVKSAAKSAGKFAASEIGARAASKIISRKEGVDEGWAAVAGSALKGGTAKGLYKAAGNAAATQVGAGVGTRIGNRVATGSNRKQMKRAKFQKKLHRKAGGYYREDIETALTEKLSGKTGLKLGSKVMGIAMGGGIAGTSGGVNVGSITRMSKRMRKTVGMGEDVSPKARSQFEIDPIKQRSEQLKMARNMYISRKGRTSQKAKAHQISKHAKPNEAGNYVQEGLAGDVAKKGYAWLTKGSDQEQFKRLGKVAVGGVVAAGAARHAWKRRKTNRKYQTKTARYHEKRYNRAAANIDYMDDVKSAKQRRRYGLRDA
jgi:hypothetical protein